MNNLDKRVSDIEKRKGKEEYIIAFEDTETGKYKVTENSGGDGKTLYSFEYLESLARSQGKSLMYVTYDKSGKRWNGGKE